VHELLQVGLRLEVAGTIWGRRRLRRGVGWQQWRLPLWWQKPCVRRFRPGHVCRRAVLHSMVVSRQRWALLPPLLLPLLLLHQWRRWWKWWCLHRFCCMLLLLWSIRHSGSCSLLMQHAMRVFAVAMAGDRRMWSGRQDCACTELPSCHHITIQQLSPKEHRVVMHDRYMRVPYTAYTHGYGQSSSTWTGAGGLIHLQPLHRLPSGTGLQDSQKHR
jgi:hypothetical protein